MLILKTLIIVCILVYLTVLIYMYTFQRNYTFHPSGDPFQSDFKPFQEFSYQSKDGLTNRGLWSPARPGHPTIVYFQGNAGNIGERLFKTKYFLPKGYGFVLIGYRGYSGNAGQPTEQGLYKDARAAIRAINAQDVPTKDIIFYGESMGTGVAVQMATEHPEAKALILEAPFTSFIDLGERAYWYLPVSLLMKDRFDSYSKIAKIKMPLLVVHGTNDMTVPFFYGQKLFSKATSAHKQFVTIEGAGHADLYDFKAGEAINAFLDTL